jgi:hypothetical protein
MVQSNEPTLFGPFYTVKIKPHVLWMTWEERKLPEIYTQLATDCNATRIEMMYILVELYSACFKSWGF